MSAYFDEMERESSVSNTLGGSLFDEMEAENAARLEAQMEHAKRKSPEQAAKHYNLSDQTGLPVEYIERNETAATTKKVDYSALQVRAPILANMLRDQRNADIAQQDLDNLSWFEEAARETKNVLSLVPAASFSVGAAGYATLSSLQRVIEVIPQVPVAAAAKVQDLLGFTEASDRSWNYYDDLNSASSALLAIAKGQSKASKNLIAKPNETRMHPAVMGGIQSAITNIPAMAASIITKNPNVGLSLMGGVTYGNSYVEGKEKGLNDFDAVVFGVNNSIAEVVTERIPLGALLSDIDKNTGFAKMLGKQMFAEGITEQLATVWQDAVKWGTLNPDKTLDEFMAERGDAAYNTLISTIVATGLQTSAIAGLNKISGQHEEEMIESLVQKANESKYRELDKATFETYLQEVSEEYGSVENIYIDSAAARAVIEEMEDDAAKDIITQQMAEAEDLNGDIVIPIGEFASTIATSPNYKILQSSIRLSPDADVVTINAFERIQEANKNIKENDESKRIWKEVSDQLANTGTLTRDQSKVAGEIIRDFVSTAGARRDMSASEIYEMMGLKIIGPNEEIVAPEQEAQTAFTGILDQLRQGEDTPQTKELVALLQSQGIDITQDSSQIINSLSTIKEFKQPSVNEEVIKSDPLAESQEWRSKTVVATLDDGSKQEINAGQAYDIITKRKENAQSILDCLNANS